MGFRVQGSGFRVYGSGVISEMNCVGLSFRIDAQPDCPCELLPMSASWYRIFDLARTRGSMCRFQALKYVRGLVLGVGLWVFGTCDETLGVTSPYQECLISLASCFVHFQAGRMFEVLAPYASLAPTSVSLSSAYRTWQGESSSYDQVISWSLLYLEGECIEIYLPP